MKIKLRFILFHIVYMSLLLSPILSFVPGIGYTDEIFTILLFIVGILDTINKKIELQLKILLGLFISFILIGLISTVLNGTQTIFPVLLDILQTSKFFASLFGWNVLLKKYNYDYIKKTLDPIIKFLVWIIFAICLYKILTKGFKAVVLGKTEAMNTAYIGFVLLISAVIFIKKRKYLYMVLSSAVCCLSFSSRGYGTIAIFLLLYLTKRWYKGNKKVLFIIAAIICGACLASNDITRYLLNSSSSRATMLIDSVKIAIKNFPFGAGFAMFGSPSAKKYYSSLYYALGYNNRKGMGYKTTGRLTDMFWPDLFGQFGFIGALIFSLFLLVLYRMLLEKCRDSINSILCINIIFIFLLICTLGGITFFNSYIIIIDFLLIASVQYKNNF